MSSPTVSEDTEWSECAGLLYHDFASFAARCFRELNPRARLAMNWHVEVMAGKLAAVREGRIRRLMICVPPRHLKSHLASVCFPAWCLGHDPSAQLSLRQLRAGPRRQTFARLPAHRRQRLVPEAVSGDAAVAAARGGARIRDDGEGFRIATSVGSIKLSQHQRSR
jgi:hypothetical protein